MYGWPFYLLVVTPFTLTQGVDWVLYIITVALSGQQHTPSPSDSTSPDSKTEQSGLVHSVKVMVLSLLFGTAWCLGLLASYLYTDNDLHTICEYLFGFLVLAHAILLLLLHTFPSKYRSLSCTPVRLFLWYVAAACPKVCGLKLTKLCESCAQRSAHGNHGPRRVARKVNIAEPGSYRPAASSSSAFRGSRGTQC